MLFLLIPFLFVFLKFLLFLVCSWTSPEVFLTAFSLQSDDNSSPIALQYYSLTDHYLSCLSTLFLSPAVMLLKTPIGYNFKCYVCGSSSDHDDGVFWCIINELCLLLASGESPCVTDSGHISAAVEEDMTVVILLSVSWEGLNTQRRTHTNTHILIW